MKEMCCVLLAYMLIGLIFAIIHFAVLNMDENRMNVAKVLFWPITMVWYIIYAIIWLINTLFLLIKHVILSIFYLIKNFNV